MADPVIPAVAATTAVETPVTAAPVAAESTLLTAPAAAVPAVATPAADATKNADGTAKTPEQIAADKKVADDKAAAKPVGAPEKYEDFKAPEGVTLNPETLTEFQAFAKSNNLSQDAAQKLVDMAVKNGADNAALQAKQWTEARATWLGEIQADKEIGGANFGASKEYAIKAITKFGSPELNKVMETGWGDNPALFKFCVKIGKQLGEDKVVNGAAASTSQPSIAQQLYPTHGK